MAPAQPSGKLKGKHRGLSREQQGAGGESRGACTQASSFLNNTDLIAQFHPKLLGLR